MPDFERKKQIVRLLVEEVEIDTVKEDINVKHIILLSPTLNEPESLKLFDPVEAF